MRENNTVHTHRVKILNVTVKFKFVAIWSRIGGEVKILNVTVKFDFAAIRSRIGGEKIRLSMSQLLVRATVQFGN
jgi:hypothetical protein